MAHSSDKSRCIVVGAGWAGLACALSLARSHFAVTLIEAAPQAGGRARCISFGAEQVDNGQHLMLGAYQSLSLMLAWLNIEESSVLQRHPFKLEWFTALQLSLPRLFYPGNLLAGLLMAQGFSWQEKYALVQFFLYARKTSVLSEDCSAKLLLERLKQPKRLIEGFWNSIVLSALSTPLELASAQVFLNVLKESFLKNSSFSDLLLAKVALSELFPTPAIKYLQDHQHTVALRQRVTELAVQNGSCQGVYTQNQQFWEAEHVVIAIPPWQVPTLFKPIPELGFLSDTLARFKTQPITTAYFKFNKPLNFKLPLMGLLGGSAHWWFDRKDSGQPDVLAAVISGPGLHNDWSHAELISKLQTEILQQYPHLGPALETRVVREKFAAFSCEIGVQSHRPSHHTPITGLWLAGDYTFGPYPASLEAALQSGLKCADLIKRSLPRH